MRDNGGLGRGGCAAVRVHEGANTIKRFSGDTATIAQTVCKFAIVNRASSESRFGETRATAVFRDFLKQLLGVHWFASARCGEAAFPQVGGHRTFGESLDRRALSNQSDLAASTTKFPLISWARKLG